MKGWKVMRKGIQRVYHGYYYISTTMLKEITTKNYLARMLIHRMVLNLKRVRGWFISLTKLLQWVFHNIISRILLTFFSTFFLYALFFYPFWYFYLIKITLFSHLFSLLLSTFSLESLAILYIIIRWNTREIESSH